MRLASARPQLLAGNDWPLRGCALAALLLTLQSGCVSKSKAQAQARAAFFAGQQQAAQQVQLQGPTVTVIGPVKNKLLPWTLDLTLAKAVIAAEYYGAQDPTEITIIRDGRLLPVDPRQLLAGEDLPLQPRDIVELKTVP